MRKSIVLLVCVLIGVSSVGASDDREIRRTFDSKDLATLRVEIPVAEVYFVGGPGTEIEITIDLECRRANRECEEALEDLRLEDRMRRDTLVLELDGYPKWGKGRIEVDARITLPAKLDLDIEVGVGDVGIEGMRAGLDVELGVGELEIMTGPDHLHSIDLDVGVGEAEIYGDARHVEGKRSFLVGSEVYWAEGKGTYRITADVGVGEATVRVD